jgi:hypothetical protein
MIEHRRPNPQQVLRQRVASIRISAASYIAVGVLVASLVALTAGTGTAVADAHHGRASFERSHRSDETSQPSNSTAVAVNTTDHSLVFKLTFAILRVTGNVIDNQNIAVAYASCNSCQTVAISIQTLLVDGAAPTVVPINEASARNQNCDQCDTVAIAYQFVIAPGTKLRFLPGARREIAYIQRQLEKLREEVRRTGMTGPQIVAAVATLMNQYANILSTELVAASQAGGQGSQAGASGATPPAVATSTTGQSATVDTQQGSPGGTVSTTTSTTTAPTTSTPAGTSGGSGASGTTTVTTPTTTPTDSGTTSTTTTPTTPTTTTATTPTTTTGTTTTTTSTTGTTTAPGTTTTTTAPGTTTTPGSTATTTTSSSTPPPTTP